MESRVLLSILIPTYNRCKYLESQLEILEREYISGNIDWRYLELIVGDNASSDETAQILMTYSTRLPFMQIVARDSNLGMMGNIHDLIHRAKGDYIWVLSDDDVIKKGIIYNICSVLLNNSVEYLFVNFSFKGESTLLYKGYEGLVKDSKDFVKDIYRQGYGYLVLISACVYRRKTILPLMSVDASYYLGSFLFFSLVSCSKGNVYILNGNFLSFTPNNGSYKGMRKEMNIKFYEYINILERIVDFGYSVEESKELIDVFFYNQIHAYLLYLLYNPMRWLYLTKYVKRNHLQRILKLSIEYRK